MENEGSREKSSCVDHDFQKSLRSDGTLEWKCMAHPYNREGLVVELDGDQLIVSGHEKNDSDSSFRHHSVRQLTLPEEIDKDSVRCYIDQHGDLTVEGSQPHSHGQRHHRFVPVIPKPAAP